MYQMLFDMEYLMKRPIFVDDYLVDSKNNVLKVFKSCELVAYS